jgi:selenocysteine-specific elongation factor
VGRGVIVGTAGHIDHGKTSLIRALTGVDTDRLPEEKRRGITIELGFAPLRLDGLEPIGIVDVPGHEAFVRTMLAGATGIDVALLVVAADEGVMPQTREHLAILSLLGVRGGVVALTKSDLVDEDWLALVADDLRDTLAGTALADAPIVPTSAATGAGLDALRAALAAAVRGVPAREGSDLFRLPVDRVFTVRGTGTVVTGTVWSGELERDQIVRILPGGATARVRVLQQHGGPVASVGPGARAAVALVGVEVADVPRGSVLVVDAAWEPTDRMRAQVTVLDDAAMVLGPRTRVQLHLGTTSVPVRVVAAGGALEPGASASARVVLEQPLVARAGDRFVLRALSPARTIGGGVVSDPRPAHRRVRPWPADAVDPASRLALMLAESGPAGVERRALSIRLGVAPGDVGALLAAESERVLVLGAHVHARNVTDDQMAGLVVFIDEYHSAHPLEPAAPISLVRSRLGAPPDLFEHLLGRLVADGVVVVEQGQVRRRDWSPRLSSSDERVLVELDRAIEAAGVEPPSVAELTAACGGQVPSLLRMRERAGAIVAVEADRYISARALGALVERMQAQLEAGREYSPGELRDVVGVSRKYLIPLLEYFDRRALTERTSSGRRWRGT